MCCEGVAFVGGLTIEMNRRDQRIDHRRDAGGNAIELRLIVREQRHTEAAVSGDCSRVCRNRSSGWSCFARLSCQSFRARNTVAPE